MSLVGILAGLGVADLTTTAGPPASGPADLAASGPGSSTTAASPTTPTTATTTVGPDLTSTVPSTAPPTAPSTTAAPVVTSASTVATTAVVTTPAPTTVLTTVAPTTAAPTTTRPPAPALITVSYEKDMSGALSLARLGSGTITLVNSGGQVGQWLLAPAPGAPLAMGPATSGQLAPGQSVTLTVTDRGGEPRATSISGVVAPNTRVTVTVVIP